MSEAAAVKTDTETAKELREYLASLAGHGDIRIALERRRPTHWGPHNTQIKGHIANFDEPISEEEIKEMYGGGSYVLRISLPNNDGTGRMKYFTNRTVTIAGDPKVTGMGELDPPRPANGAPPPEAPSAVIAAMKSMESMVDRSQRMAENQKGIDPAMQALLQGMQLQLQQLQQQLQVKDDRILSLVTQKPDRGATDVLLEKMIAGEHGQIMAIRAQHESELNALRERLTQEIERANSRNDDTIRREEDGHKRELQLLQMTYEGRIQAIQAAHHSETDGLKRELQNATDSLKRELSFLHAQYTETKAELGSLKTKKDKSPIESIQEMAALKEAFETIGGGGDEAPKGKIEALMETFAPAIEAVATRIATPAPPPPAPAPPPQPQITHLPDGRVIARRADGTLEEVRRKPKLKAPSGEDLPDIDPSDMTMAIAYLENAARNEVEPSAFVRSIAGTVPGAVIVCIRELGVDNFLVKVAKTPASSILRATQAGKNWIREVGRLLVDQ